MLLNIKIMFIYSLISVFCLIPLLYFTHFILYIYSLRCIESEKVIISYTYLNVDFIKNVLI